MMTTVRHLWTFQHLVSLNLDGSDAKMAKLILLSDGNPSIKEFTVRWCVDGFSGHYVPYERGIRKWRLKFFDCSSSDNNFPRIFHENLLDDPECPTTHLYLENCWVRPRKIPNHSKIQYVSLAGCKANWSKDLVNVIDQWASHHAVKRVNASGCRLTQTQRENLLRKHGNIINLEEDFQESVRVKV